MRRRPLACRKPKCGRRFLKRAWALFKSGARGNIFDTVLEDLGIFDKELVSHLVYLYRAHHPDISLQSDAMEFLR